MEIIFRYVNNIISLVICWARFRKLLLNSTEILYLAVVLQKIIAEDTKLSIEDVEY
ncbi:unnamed protein product, partial [Vitis vinifera]|uniref:Uncharacterized protein n=1 Tax=Vitis vinifera TaxID=29760 RepID=D7SWU7_VITVI